MSNFNPDCVFVIGVGGTGGHIAPPLTRLIQYHPNTTNTRVFFIDGDEFEEKNMTRQIVGDSQVGLNKARAMVDTCAQQGLTNNIECVEDYVTAANFSPMLRRSNRPLVVCSVDNDSTRKDIIEAIQDNCNGDFFFITPGNSDGTEDVRGQTLYWGRVNGETVGLNPMDVYPNIENPQDAIPRKGSCANLAPSRPQLISANFFAAAITLSVIQNLLDGVLNFKTSSMFFNLRNLKTSIS